MARSYRECPACGKRALSIATRCPQCGHELSSQPVRRPPSTAKDRLRPLAMAAGMVLVGGGLVVLLVRRNGGRDHDTSTTTAYARAEAPAPLDTAPPAPASATADSAPTAEAVQRFARTWTKVHARRSVRSDVVAVLLPGDTVLADSLKGGWWRVALEGQVLGYVYARTLTGD